MYFEQINKNTWRCIADGPRHPVTGKRKQISRRGKTKTEAKKRVEEAIEKIKGSVDYSEKITYQEFMEEWLKLYRLKGNKETTVKHREYCLSLMGNHLGKLKIAELTSKQLQDTLNMLFDKGTAYYTLRGIKNALDMLFKYALETGLIESNPTTPLFVPKEKSKLVDEIKDETAKLYLEPWELKKFLELADAHRNVLYRTMIYVIAFTGMRPGEALALKLKDVDLKNKKIHITKTVYAKGSLRGDFELTPPKTKNAIRTIDIDDIVIEKIQYLLDYKEQKDWISSEYLFGDVDGIPPTIKILNQHIRRLGQKTGIEKQFRTYILRHTHISLLAEAGVDLQFIMGRVGHKNSKTTTQIYLHVTEGMRENAAQKMHTKFTELLSKNKEK
ncbi:tyrosine-type recombinase/integrase [Lysinibacillus sp. KU-BSD001]|uniref:tyrosine-type recombinase/integrase n=1 Tax=Lysinibacillus sp. KU-BSD001 TaxID=3141328 RepID=UPI0036E945D2